MASGRPKFSTVIGETSSFPAFSQERFNRLIKGAVPFLDLLITESDLSPAL
jgi:hypothetical protein